MSHLSNTMLERDMSKGEIYRLCSEGCIALEDFDLPAIEEMIELGYWQRSCVTAYFRDGVCACHNCSR